MGCVEFFTERVSYRGMAKNGYTRCFCGHNRVPLFSVTETAQGRHLIGQNPLLPDDGYKPAGCTGFWLFDLQWGTRKYSHYPKRATNTRALRPTDHTQRAQTPTLRSTTATDRSQDHQGLSSLFIMSSPKKMQHSRSKTRQSK